MKITKTTYNDFLKMHEVWLDIGIIVLVSQEEIDSPDLLQARILRACSLKPKITFQKKV